MVDRQAITDEYDRREKEAGGVAHVDPRQIAVDIAEEMGVPYEHVREVLTEHFVTGPC